MTGFWGRGRGESEDIEKGFSGLVFGAAAKETEIKYLFIKNSD